MFTTAWTNAGKSSSLIHRVQGAWFGTSSGGLSVDAGAYQNTQSLMVNCMKWGEAPDHICVGPYLTMPADWPLLQAFSPAGGPAGGSAGSWPIDAMNDFYRFWIAYSQGVWAQWAAHAQFLVNYGQPLTAFSTATATGGTIPAGSYFGYYTFVDGQGRETTVGLSQAVAGVTASGAISVGMPAVPPWATSVNFYLSQPGAAAAPPAHARVGVHIDLFKFDERPRHLHVAPRDAEDPADQQPGGRQLQGADPHLLRGRRATTA